MSWDVVDAVASVETFGDGGAWLRDRAPRLLGLEDDLTGFTPTTPAMRALAHRHPGLRLVRTGTLWHDLACLIVQQRINGLDAAQQWRRLVRALGMPAPGPSGLITPPSPATLAGLGYHDLHHFGIERQRADTLRRAAAAVARLENRVDDNAAPPCLRSVRGVGPWTSSSLAALTWGERDTVVVGDHGIPATVAWALEREEKADDVRLVELLEPHRPHRYRVIRLAMADGSPPRHHPRGRRTDIRRI